MTYNLTNYTSANTVLELSVAVNQLTHGLFFPLMLGLLLLISVSTLAGRFELADSALSGSAITAVAAGILWVTGLIQEGILLVFFGLFVLALLAKLLIKT